jgi:hypothetical protein
VFDRLNGKESLFSRGPDAASRTIGWALMTSEDPLGTTREAIMVFDQTGHVLTLCMPRSPLSLALLRRLMAVTGGRLTWTKEAVGLHPDEAVARGAVPLSSSTGWMGALKRRRAQQACQRVLETLTPVSLADLDKAAQDMQGQGVFPDASFQALHATLLQASMGEALPAVAPVSYRKVRL